MIFNQTMFMQLIGCIESFRKSEKPTARSYGHGTESKTSIQPIAARKIIAQPIRMLGHDTVTARHEPYHYYFPLIRKRLY